MRRALFATVLLVAAWLYAEPQTVRVRLFSVERPSEIRLVTANGETIEIEARTLRAPLRTHGPVSIYRGTSEPVAVDYPLEVSAPDHNLVIVAELPMEDYVAAVLAGEAAGFRSEASLKAMAVAIRTYAAHFLNRHESEGFNFCDTTHCQDLRITAVTRRLQEAAAATRNEVLEYDGQTIAAYYHEDCGGITEPRGPYLQQIRDAFCVRDPTRWATELTLSELRKAVDVADADQLDIVERTPSGRAQRLRLRGTMTKTMDAEAFRLAVGRTLGWNRIRSDL
jgi:stage II sporulation protein D